MLRLLSLRRGQDRQVRQPERSGGSALPARRIVGRAIVKFLVGFAGFHDMSVSPHMFWKPVSVFTRFDVSAPPAATKSSGSGSSRSWCLNLHAATQVSSYNLSAA